MNFSVLSRGEWFVFIIPAVMSFVPIVDIWTKFSIKFISLLRLKGEREDATAFVTGCVMFIMVAIAIWFDFFSRLFGMVNYANVTYAIHREAIIHGWMNFIIVMNISSAILCAWIALKKRISALKWICYGALMGWSGIIYLLAISREKLK